MAQLPPPVARLRVAVRRCLTALPASSTVMVACSGGADSLALAATTAFVAPRLGLRAALVTVDHGLQDGSARRASSVADWARVAGLEPAEVATVDVSGLPGGPEAAARSARYAALSAAAERVGAVAVLLGHTRDDQAETVLLALARGAGPRGLSGMPYEKGVFLRPLLGVARDDTRKACAALGLVAWEDPHNTDPAYARSRVRGELMPALVAALGPGVVDNLARTAAQLAADNAALDELAAEALCSASPAPAPAGLSSAGPAPAEPAATAPLGSGTALSGGERASVSSGGTAGGSERGGFSVDGAAGGSERVGVSSGGAGGSERVGFSGGGAAGGSELEVAALAGLAAAIRTRVLHRWARELGAPGGALSHRHVAALDALITDWHGQGPTRLPGDIAVARCDGKLRRVGAPDM